MILHADYVNGGERVTIRIFTDVRVAPDLALLPKLGAIMGITRRIC